MLTFKTHDKSFFRLLILLVLRGISQIKKSQVIRIMAGIPAGLIIFFIMTSLLRFSKYALFDYFGPLLIFFSIIGLLLAFIGIIIVAGNPLKIYLFYKKFQRINLVNRFGEAPVLISNSVDKNNEKISVLLFDALGIPLEKWNDEKKGIEAILNCYIVSIKETTTRSRIAVSTVPFIGGLPQLIIWNDKLIPEPPNVFLLGVGLQGKIFHDISVVAHMLIGGSSGSGKSVLIKILIRQILLKGYSVFIADFKGAIDYPRAWKNFIVIDREEVIKMLDVLLQHLHERKILFEKLDYDNIDNYNKAVDAGAFPGPVSKLNREFFICDEVAEMLDATGANKDEKEIIHSIILRLSKIARLGRAFGIHLILGTQRPDANILPGQIKNNIDCRICGRADDVLSKIIIDNTSASDEIPFDAQGRFIMRDGTVFQGYYADNDSLAKYNAASFGEERYNPHKGGKL